MTYTRMIYNTKKGKRYGGYDLYWYKSVRKGKKVIGVYIGKVNVDWHNTNKEQQKTIINSLRKHPFRNINNLTDVYIKPQLSLGYSTKPQLSLGYSATFKQTEKGVSVFISEETLEGVEKQDFANLVIGHEIGHNLYHTKLNSEQKSNWRSFHYENIDLMPSEYSKQSPDESFSESYTRFINNSSNYPLNEKIKLELSKYLGEK